MAERMDEVQSEHAHAADQSIAENCGNERVLDRRAALGKWRLLSELMVRQFVPA